MRRTHQWLIMAPAAVLALVALWASPVAGKKTTVKKARERAVPVRVAVARQKLVDVDIRVTGNAKPLRTVAVTPMVKGKFYDKVLVDVGDRVENGQVVAILRRDTIDHQIAQLRARIKATRHQTQGALAGVRAGIWDLKRYRRLVQKKLMAPQKLVQYRARVQGLRANYGALKYQVKQLEAKLKELMVLSDYHRVKAHLGVGDVSGLVIRRSFDPGSVSDNEKAVLMIIVDDPMKVEVSLDQRRMAGVTKGMRVRFRSVGCNGRREHWGRVARVYPLIDAQTRTGTIEVRVNNPGRCIKAGTFLRGRIILARRREVVVPLEALTRFPGAGQYYVFVVENGRARRMNVTRGPIVGRDRVIEGVKPGQVVVVRGQGSLITGRLVKVVK